MKKWLAIILFIYMNISYASPSLLTLDIQGANLADTVRLLAKFLKINIVMSPNISGVATLHLQNAEPKSAFDLLLTSENLAKWQMGNVLFIASRDELLKRKEADIKWQNLLDETSPLSVLTWRVKYARAEDVARLLQDEHSSLMTKRGSVRVDPRINMIYIEDISSRLVTIRTLIQKLDVPVQQVQIKARLASVDSDMEKTLGVRFVVTAPGSTPVTPGEYSVAVAHLADSSTLDIKLAALESSGKAELISSPSLFTANLQSAEIEAGEEVPYQEVSESGGTAVVFKKAVLGLKVIPQVLPGNKILLQLQINQDRPSHDLILGMPTISTRQIKTTVLIKAGETIVLGGIYEDNHESGEQRIPFLSDVPILGRLFTDHISQVTKRELLIFITPKVSTDTI